MYHQIVQLSYKLIFLAFFNLKHRIDSQKKKKKKKLTHGTIVGTSNINFRCINHKITLKYVVNLSA